MAVISSRGIGIIDIAIATSTVWACPVCHTRQRRCGQEVSGQVVAPCKGRGGGDDKRAAHLCQDGADSRLELAQQSVRRKALAVGGGKLTFKKHLLFREWRKPKTLDQLFDALQVSPRLDKLFLGFIAGLGGEQSIDVVLKCCQENAALHHLWGSVRHGRVRRVAKRDKR